MNLISRISLPNTHFTSLCSTHDLICMTHCLKSFLNHSGGKEKVDKHRFHWTTHEKNHNIHIHILNPNFNIRPRLRTVSASSTHHVLHWNQWTGLHIVQMSFCSTLLTTIWVRNFILLDFSKKTQHWLTQSRSIDTPRLQCDNRHMQTLNPHTYIKYRSRFEMVLQFSTR